MNEFSSCSMSSDGPSCRLHSAPDLVPILMKGGIYSAALLCMSHILRVRTLRLDWDLVTPTWPIGWSHHCSPGFAPREFLDAQLIFGPTCSPSPLVMAQTVSLAPALSSPWFKSRSSGGLSSWVFLQLNAILLTPEFWPPAEMTRSLEPKAL